MNLLPDPEGQCDHQPAITQRCKREGVAKRFTNIYVFSMCVTIIIEDGVVSFSQKVPA